MEQTRQKITRLEKSVERFLTRGEVKEVSDAELATALEERIRRRSQRSFPEALKDARKFLSRVKRGGYNGVLSLAAYRSLARTLHLKGDYARAAEAYAEARTLGRRDSDYRARIDRALIDVHMYRGDMPAARRSARRALAAFEKTGSAVELAKTQVNYANLLHRQDKHRDAEKLYRSAAEVFSREGQQLALARAAYNRANTLLQLFDIDEAERLYQLALDIYTRHDCLLDATDARYGLAWLRMLTGRFHDALLDLNICQHSYRAAGHRRGAPLCELDQAETLLHLNINTEALSAARAAEREFRKQALRYEASKSALFRARAAYTLGKRGEAKSALKRAFAGFQAEGNSGFLASSHLLAASLAQSPGERTRELKKSRGMFKRSQLPLWETLCDLQLALEPGTGARALERLRKSPAAHASPQLHAIWQTLLGDRDEANGQRARARRRWRTAANRLDNLRALLPPVELRTALARQEISPHRRLIAAEMGSNPLQAALWSERFKTAGLWAPAAGT
ncbi:MAG: tetratricopeptide repeat protein, partial [Candidatus Zixiibacteriota bacterium]